MRNMWAEGRRGRGWRQRGEEASGEGHSAKEIGGRRQPDFCAWISNFQSLLDGIEEEDG